MVKYEYIVFLTVNVVFGSHVTSDSELKICGSDGIFSEDNIKRVMFNKTKEITLAPPPPLKDGASVEWIFETADPDKFLTIDFTRFQLGGPECDEKAEGYSKIMIKSRLGNEEDSPPLLYCKGRRTPDPASAMGRLVLAQCNRFTTESIEFVVTTGCDAHLLARKDEKEVTVKKSNNICWMILTSIVHGITVDISNLDIKKSNSQRCKKGYINMTSVDIFNKEADLLPERKKKICKVGDNDLENFQQFRVHTDNQKIKIAYRNAEFTIKFKEEHIEKIITTDSKGYMTTAAAIEHDSSNSSLENYVIRNSDNGDDETTNYTTIIALGCGGLFVLIVIILTLIFVRRRSGNAKSTGRKFKERRSTRMSSLRYSQGTSGITRNPSSGSVNNATYGQMVVGDDTATGTDLREKKTSRKSSKQRKNEEDLRQRRLDELDDKYGPFSDTHGNYPESHYVQRPFCAVPMTLQLPEEGGLFRKGTRPLLPPPPKMSTFETSCSSDTKRVSAAGNLYESIGDSASWNQARASYITVTSDEFSDCDDLCGTSYDHTPLANNYASILGGPGGVSYDPVEEEERISTVQYTTNNNSVNETRVLSVKYETSLQNTPAINISFTTDSPSSTPSSHGAIEKPGELKNVKSHYRASRPSLPTIMSNSSYLDLSDSKSCSMTSLLQEDAENYLAPRPSCPDVMVIAYSSTEDISDMRQRILAAAHPSLLGDTQAYEEQNKGSPASKTWYDSPRPSSSEDQICTKVQYATPRRTNVSANNS